jgi:hypothetical protein
MDSRSFRKSKYLKSTDIDGGAMVVTIRDVRAEETRAGDETLVIFFDEYDGKQLTLNGVNNDSLTAIGSHDTDRWIGLRVELHTVIEPKAATGEAIRIRRAPKAVAERSKASEKKAAAVAAEGADFNDDVAF